MGIVTDIQRFSLNDGPGIRTTVFLKGCNARCAWCHNPETLCMEPELMVYADKCIKCGACVGFDPERAAEGLPPVREALTIGSARACFSGALSVAGREMGVEEVLREVVQDVAYYQASGGGVTLSGGECMMQPAFTQQVLHACRERGIQTAIETNLMYDFTLLERLLPELDLLMADIKLMDAKAHEALVGMGNGQVLQNVAMLARTGIPYILRTPVIPGVNDNPEEIGAIARFAAKHAEHLLYYELLNFNPLGASKYDSLGRENRYRDLRPHDAQTMQALQKAAEDAGIPVRIG